MELLDPNHLEPTEGRKSSALCRIGTWCFRQRKFVLAVWVVPIVGLGALALNVKQPTSDSFSGSGTSLQSRGAWGACPLERREEFLVAPLCAPTARPGSGRGLSASGSQGVGQPVEEGDLALEQPCAGQVGPGPLDGPTTPPRPTTPTTTKAATTTEADGFRFGVEPGKPTTVNQYNYGLLEGEAVAEPGQTYIDVPTTVINEQSDRSAFLLDLLGSATNSYVYLGAPNLSADDKSNGGCATSVNVGTTLPPDRASSGPMTSPAEVPSYTKTDPPSPMKTSRRGPRSQRLGTPP